jgi:hypothetical protein
VVAAAERGHPLRRRSSRKQPREAIPTITMHIGVTAMNDCVTHTTEVGK